MTNTSPPPNEEMTSRISSFTAVGHLIHINLKDHLLQYKEEIGHALLAKIPRALAVVNKVNTIENTYRNFEIEIIARRENCNMTDEELMIVEVNENKCRFQLDFSKVYWNSRLSTEHERMLKKFNKGHDIVFDLFAGVGPFSVPAAKAKCKTYANDLNPECYKWLGINMKRNKVQNDFYELHNLDAEYFILNKLKPRLFEEYMTIKNCQLATKPTFHILMNLPAIAPTFLRHFIGLFKHHSSSDRDVNSKKLLDLFRELDLDHIVYCYCFLKGFYDDPRAEIRRMMEEEMERELNDDQILDIFRVRNVAPYKDMYRVEIRLDESILIADKNTKSIMKGVKRKATSNGDLKKVTIQNGNKDHDDSDDTDIYEGRNDVMSKDESCSKKSRTSDYCRII